MRQRLAASTLLAAALAGCGPGTPTSPAAPAPSSAAPAADPKQQANLAVRKYKEGVAAFGNGRVDEGIAALREGNALQPGYTVLRYDLARMLIQRAGGSPATASARSDLDEAGTHLESVAGAWPTDANVPYFLAQVAVGRGEYAAARAHLERAIEIGRPTGAAKEQIERALRSIDEAERK